MGGRVLFALSIAAFPEDFPKPTRWRRCSRRRPARSARRAACSPAATRSATRSRSTGWRSSARRTPTGCSARAARGRGDVLLLTKRLGTGLLVSGRRQGRTSDADLDAAIDQMRTLNRAASEVLVRHGIRGATDVTGFGLLGHGLEMARASGARLVFDAAALPALDGALDLARAGIETGGAGHNRRFTAPSLEVGAGVAPELVALAHDPQTSGGLLAAVPAADVEAVEARPRRGGRVDLARRPGRGGRTVSPSPDTAIGGSGMHPQITVVTIGGRRPRPDEALLRGRPRLPDLPGPRGLHHRSTSAAGRRSLRTHRARWRQRRVSSRRDPASAA